MTTPPTFARLRCRSAFTFGLSLLRPGDIARLAAQTGGLRQVGLIDRNLLGLPAFARSCRGHGLHPVVGLEVVLRERDQEPGWPLALLAQDSEGGRNLVALASQCGQDGLGAVVLLADLEAHGQGLIGLCGGQDGRILQLLGLGRFQEARAFTGRLQEAFQGRFHLEAVPAGEPLAAAQARLEADTGATRVATPLMACEPGCGSRLQAWLPPGRRRLTWSASALDGLGAEWLDESGMAGRFDPEALARSGELAERIEPLQLDRTLFPGPGPGRNGAMDLLARHAEAGLRAHRRPSWIHDGAYLDRLRSELDLIRSAPRRRDWAEGLLAMEAAAAALAPAGLVPGPGIDNLPCSLVAMALGLHTTDPLLTRLGFERWFRPGAVSPAAEGYLQVGLAKAGAAPKALEAAFPRLRLTTMLAMEPVPGPVVGEGHATSLPVAALPALAADSGDTGGPFARSCFVQVPEQLSFPCWRPGPGTAVPATLQVDEWEAADLGQRVSLFHDPAMDVLETLLAEAGRLGLDTGGRWNLEAPDVLVHLQDLHCPELREVAAPAHRALLRRFLPESFEELVCFMAMTTSEALADRYLAVKARPDGAEHVPPWADPILAPTRGILMFDQQVLDLARLAGLDPEAAEHLRRSLILYRQSGLEMGFEAFLAGARQRGLMGAADLADRMRLEGPRVVNRAHCVSRAQLLWEIAWVRRRLREKA